MVRILLIISTVTILSQRGKCYDCKVIAFPQIGTIFIVKSGCGAEIMANDNKNTTTRPPSQAKNCDGGRVLLMVVNIR